MARTARNFRQSLRLLARDWRAGELRLFVVALVIAVGAITAVGFFNDRVDRGLTRRSADVLGADLILTSSEPVAREWVDATARYGMKVAEALEFASVVIRGERLQIVGVRAIGAGYPPRGVVRTAPGLGQADRIETGIPAPGTAWVEPRVAQELALSMGDKIEVGSAAFTVARILTDEPGRSANFFALSPRVLIPLTDVPRTKVVQPGSRVSYRYAFAGAAVGLRAYEAWLRPQLGPSHRLVQAREGNPTIARAVERVERYVGLTSLLAVMLAGVAIAMGARRYSARHYDAAAMLRSLGATQRDILELYLPQLFVLGLVASAVGCVIGFVVQQVIYYLLQNLFPASLPLPGPWPAVFGISAGLITLAGFALIPILRLRSVPPLRVLRRELAPLPVSAWAVIAAAGAALVILMWRYTGSLALTLGVLAGAAVAIAALFALTLGFLRLARGLRSGAGSIWRQGLDRLQRRAHASTGQILAFGLTLMAMAVLVLVRTDLLSSWREQLPDDAPNYFVFNVLPDNAPAVEAFLRDHALRSQPLYPMVRGRLTEINGAPAMQAVAAKDKDSGPDVENAALQRDLNLTWAAAAPSDNVIVRGQWWGEKPGAALISVEEKLAERLGVGLGDRLTFVIGSDPVEATVASIRRVKWESFHPNFFVIFSPGSLDGYPATYMTSFYVAPEQKPLLTNLVRQFPGATLFELDQLINQIRSVVRQASLAVELVLLFVLAAGFAVLYAALASSLDERYYEGALLRTFGASRWQLRRGHLAEFVTLGVLAGVLAAIGTEAIAYVLYTRVFDIAYTPKWPVWIAAPLVGGVLIGVAGFIGTRRVVERSPLTMLREN
jgi:putative ABC transport system permease protein